MKAMHLHGNKTFSSQFGLSPLANFEISFIVRFILGYYKNYPIKVLINLELQNNIC